MAGDLHEVWTIKRGDQTEKLEFIMFPDGKRGNTVGFRPYAGLILQSLDFLQQKTEQTEFLNREALLGLQLPSLPPVNPVHRADMHELVDGHVPVACQARSGTCRPPQRRRSPLIIFAPFAVHRLGGLCVKRLLRHLLTD